MPFFFKTETCQHFQKVFILLFLWLFGGLVAKLCPTLVTPWTVACQAPLFVGILQERILEWVAIPFSRGSSRPRNWTEVSSITDRFITDWATREIRYSYIWVQNKKKDNLSFSIFSSCEDREICHCSREGGILSVNLWVASGWAHMYVLTRANPRETAK